MENQTKEELLRRLICVEGHVRGVVRMVEDDRPCIAVLHQIRAVQGSLKQASILLVAHHLDHCLRDAWPHAADNSRKQVRDEFLALLEPQIA